MNPSQIQPCVDRAIFSVSDSSCLNVDGILEQTMEHLRHLELPVPVEIDAECRSIVKGIVLEVAAELPETLRPSKAPGPFLSYVAKKDDLELGELHSERRSHPAESLVIADILFDVALPHFVDWGAQLGCDTIHVVRVLHHVIWRRFPAGAIGYTEGLRRRLFETDRESRLRVSRDLHDRVAHGIAAGIQRVELGMAGGGAVSHLDDALAILRSSLEEVRWIATDLRRHVGDRTLEESLSALADDARADCLRLHVRSEGQPLVLPVATREEVYLIALEAIRNAREHADSAHAIQATISWSGRELTVTIADDGGGFDPERTVPRGGLGIHAMRERALNLGGTLSIDSVVGQGTSVELIVPHSGDRT